MRKNLIAVDQGALQMVFNILGRGTPVQIEAMEELKKTCVPLEDLERQVVIETREYTNIWTSDSEDKQKP